MKLGFHKLIIIFTLLTFAVKSEPVEGYLVNIQVLDKITAKVENVNIKVNSFYQYDTIKIYIYACYTNPPEEIPEDFVLLRIYDDISRNENNLLYQGWMISSSPASTPLQHPIYDLWLKDCKVNNDL